MIAPCKDCPNRKVGCHADCKPYLEFAEERQAIRERHKNDVCAAAFVSKAYQRNIAENGRKRQRMRRI